MATVEELVTIFRVDSKDAVQNLNNFTQGIKQALGATLGLVSAQRAWSSFRGVIDATAQMQIFADTTGVSTDRLQEWRYAAESMGLSASAVQSDLAKMQQQAAWSGRSLESFADMFKGMSAPVANIWGNAIGISPDTVRLLREGREGLARLKEEAHESGAVISEEDIEKAYEFKRTLAGLTIQARAFGMAIALGVMPFASKILDWFKEFNSENREWMRTKATQIAEAFGKALERIGGAITQVKDKLGLSDENSPLSRFIKVMSEGVEWGRIFTGVLGLLVFKFGGLALALAKPLLILGLLAVAFEDLKTYMEGGESYIGDFLAAVQGAFPNVIRLFSELGQKAVPIAVAALKDLWATLKNIYEFFKSSIGVIIDGIDKTAAAMRKLLGLMTPEEEAAYEKQVLAEGQARADTQLTAEGWTQPQNENPKLLELRKQNLRNFANNVAQMTPNIKAAAQQPIDVRAGGPRMTTTNVNNDNKVSVTINGLDPVQTALKIKEFIPKAEITTPGLYTETVY